ncbi:MAG: orotidine 5'-phosphate decarboxylase [Candidatus Micrarchaeota archaeon]|nr:orotidine 5'-phosphate decarboxylase [Candidatus Micrarchaeota archaeon]
MQYVMPLSLDDYKKINSAAHAAGLISILDNKLGDIGASNEAGIYWAAQAGFDALTFSPFAGNIEETTGFAHDKNLGIIVLTLMSNPEAKYFMRDNAIGGKKGYEWIAHEIGRCGSDGAVVGATNKDTDAIAQIRKAIGQEKVILIPGVGAQGGDLKSTHSAFGRNILVNVGRAVLYAKNPGTAAKEYNEMLNGLVTYPRPTGLACESGIKPSRGRGYVVSP